MKVINLTASELMLAAHLSGLIRGVKQVQHSRGDVNNRRVADYDDFGLHYLGMLGEMAVARVLGVPVREDVTRYGDGMVDTEFRGETIQVKTSSHAALNRKRLVFFNSMDEFRARWLIACSIQSPSSVAIHGFISRQKFDRMKFPHDFGYGPRVCVDEESLAPIDKLDTAIPVREIA